MSQISLDMFRHAKNPHNCSRCLECGHDHPSLSYPIFVAKLFFLFSRIFFLHQTKSVGRWRNRNHKSILRCSIINLSTDYGYFTKTTSKPNINIAYCQFVMMTAFQSDPIGWDEPGYLSNDACRTMFRKWLIITHPTESPKNIKVCYTCHSAWSV